MTKKKNILSIAIDKSLQDKLKELSREKHISVSRLVSRLVEEALYLEENVFKDEIYKNIDWLSQEWKDKLQFLFTKVLDTTPDPIWIKDLNLRIIYVNQAFADLFGLKKEEIIGKSDIEYLPSEIAKESIFSDMQALEKKQSTHTVEKIEKDGKVRYFDVIKTPLFNKSGKIVAILGISRDITNLVETKEELERKNRELLDAYQKLKELHEYDNVTGFMKRNKFIEEFDNLLKSKDRSTLTVVMIDINNFKYINEIYGFEFGDRLLREISNQLKNFVENIDNTALLGKLSGDEFAVLFKRDIDLNEIVKRFKEILSQIKLNTPKYHSIYSPKAVYCAVKVEPDITLSAEEIVTHMEVAIFDLRESKDTDFSIIDLKENISSVELEEKLVKALENKKIVPFLQPVYDFKNDEIIGYEVFARIEDEGNYIEAKDFITVAYRKDFIVPIDHEILEIVKNEIMPLIEDDKKLFINLSSFSLNKLENIADPMAKEIIFIKDRSVFDINEQEFLRNISNITDIKRSYNISFSIDDFGTGNTSFRTLIRISEEKIISYLKIDGSLMKELGNSEEKKNIVRSIVAACKQLGIKTVAENIENEKIYEAVLDIGIDCGQGNYLSQPEHYERVLKK
ncbi:MAG TPA: GGDEF domain-containing protein [Persephonella sp.]|uniref:Putative eal/ggdef/pas domain protein n=1 Tax=Persephonella marina (strain DSM 14350 / EX-H1) TaxID=123214 RepID=C0QQF0_PERMH|nr:MULTISPECIES: EAL domain-containing protein [Persephonella]ACO03699.1 putative eal/ggdef/pas domain protein [Persephonella marina EX-H1]HCB69498.1 GGDEF domain-containing protein [Persephonella sp.]